MADFEPIAVNITVEKLEKIANMDVLTEKVETENDNTIVTATALLKTLGENLELPNEIIGDLTVTSENGDESVRISDGVVSGRQGGTSYKITPDNIILNGGFDSFSLGTQGVNGNDTAKASWQEWLDIGNIETALDNIIAGQEAIIAIQNALIGGDNV